MLGIVHKTCTKYFKHYFIINKKPFIKKHDINEFKYMSEAELMFSHK